MTLQLGMPKQLCKITFVLIIPRIMLWFDTVTGKIKVIHPGLFRFINVGEGRHGPFMVILWCIIETKDPKFLDFAQKVTDVYLKNLPEDLIPYWDFNAQGIPKEPGMFLLLCVVASALLELSTFVSESEKAKEYRTKAERMHPNSLSSAGYQSRNANDAFFVTAPGINKWW